MIKEVISKLVENQNLTEPEMSTVMNEIMNGETSEPQIAAFLTALRMKGETSDEITAAAKVMRDHSVPVKVHGILGGTGEPVMDTCGTGGDRLCTFNVSTAVAFVVAGGEVIVAKHGNRSVSSQCGSADVMESLGIKIDVPVTKVEECLDKLGLAFLFAPNLHPAMKYAIGPRRQIGIRTIFNILGPLSNPARANVQLLGVYTDKLLEPLSRVLGNLGLRHTFVVHGKDGMDEISLTGETQVAELVNGNVKTYTFVPEEFGFTRVELKSLQGGDVKRNAEIIRSVLAGDKSTYRDAVLLNAGVALVAAGKVKIIKEGISLAKESIDSGAARNKLNKLAELTNS